MFGVLALTVSLLFGFQQQQHDAAPATQPSANYEIVDNHASGKQSSRRATTPSSSIRKSAGPTGKPRKIKSDKLKGMPKFKKPKKAK